MQAHTTSAVKTIGLRIIFSMFFLLMFFSCDKSKVENTGPEKIDFITLSHVGGALGNYTIIKVTQDSVHFEDGNTANKKHKEWSKAIDQKVWENLISSIKLKDLNIIESSSSIQKFDGIDEIFQIKTSKKSYLFVNTYNDVHYKQFKEFKIKLENLVPKQTQ